jgi:8-oxo-dGTP pyrophosphatase MutT (NUDIX family)
MTARTNASETRRGLQREVSAGGVVFRREASGPFEVVLVRPAGRDSWVLPKGHLEAGESVSEAALRETREETGLDVSIAQPLGEVAYFFSHRADNNAPVRIFKRVHFFLMNCIGGDTRRHDHEIEEVRWMTVADALKTVSHENERILLERAAAALGS